MPSTVAQYNGNMQPKMDTVRAHKDYYPPMENPNFHTHFQKPIESSQSMNNLSKAGGLSS